MTEKLTQHVLVATDFSNSSIIAVDAAAIVARQNQAKCTLMHVLDPTPLAPRGHDYQVHTESMTVEPEVEQAIHEELRKVAERHLSEVEGAKTALVLHHNAARGICDYAEKENVDLIVVATHGRTGMSHFLIGSVAEKVVRHAPCPVLTLRSHQDD
jgi:nucleotide-binding universal stress UspA family protein